MTTPANSINEPTTGVVGMTSTGFTATPLTQYLVCLGHANSYQIDQVASAGTAGQVLTSNGAGAEPTFQNASSGGAGYVLSVRSNNASPADGITYFFAEQQAFTSQTTSGTRQRHVIPKTGTLKQCYGIITVTVAGSSENCTVSIRHNNTTNIDVTTTLQLTGLSNPFNNTGLSTAVTAGDYIEFIFISPTWVTNPTNATITISAFIET